MNVESALKDMMKEAVREVLAEQRPPSPVIEGPPAMSIKQAAAEYGLAECTLRNWVHRADCDFVIKVGRNHKILRHKFVPWLERQTEAANDL